jgi:hypothetical protein
MSNMLKCSQHRRGGLFTVWDDCPEFEGIERGIANTPDEALARYLKNIAQTIGVAQHRVLEYQLGHYTTEQHQVNLKIAKALQDKFLQVTSSGKHLNADLVNTAGDVIGSLVLELKNTSKPVISSLVLELKDTSKPVIASYSSGHKVKDLIADLLWLDQEADICIADIYDFNHAYTYNKLHKININTPNGYRGYVLSIRHNLNEEVPCEHMQAHKDKQCIITAGNNGTTWGVCADKHNVLCTDIADATYYATLYEKLDYEVIWAGRQ